LGEDLRNFGEKRAGGGTRKETSVNFHIYFISLIYQQYQNVIEHSTHGYYSINRKSSLLLFAFLQFLLKELYSTQKFLDDF